MYLPQCQYCYIILFYLPQYLPYPGIYLSQYFIDPIIVLYFVQCGPEYKLPGLYVVDSIVRQSRHQFGTEKDAFGPRFSKNFLKTFRNLFLCTPGDQVQFKCR